MSPQSVSADPQFSLNTDALVHHGHHFGHTIHALCLVHTLLTNGLLHNVEEANEPEECFIKELGVYLLYLLSLHSQSAMLRQKREYNVYRQLLKMVPLLEEHLLNGSKEEILHIADMICLYVFSTHFLNCEF
jgi:hypothetical protein